MTVYVYISISEQNDKQICKQLIQSDCSDMFVCDRLSFFEASDDGFLSASQLALGAWPSEA